MTTDTATAGGWTLSVTSARITRAGPDIPWEVTVRRDGGFRGPITSR